ncbi:MAG: DUF2111 domain-containing protein [Methanoregula sp.]|nr:DUF2111 domain-containing protein [Methanoregula sp.]
MHRYTFSASADATAFEPLILAVHELLHRLPMTARSVEKLGLRVEDGRVIDRNYDGPILVEAIASKQMIKTTPKSGAYKGVPVTVAPIKDEDGEVIGAIGIVDITGIFDLATLMENQSAILKQVCGKDPCPLPSEQTNSKR